MARQLNDQTQMVQRRQWFKAAAATIMLLTLLVGLIFLDDLHLPSSFPSSYLLVTQGATVDKTDKHQRQQPFLEDANDDKNGDDGSNDSSESNDDNDDVNQSNDEDNDNADDNKENDDTEQEEEEVEEDDQPVYIDDEYYAYDDSNPLDFFPLTGRQVVGLLFASMGVTLAAGGGIGGGGIILPIYILVLQFSPIDAVPLTAVTVCGAAAGSTYLNMGKRHPLADRPVIDWDVVLVMEPLVLCGNFLGTLMHQTLSDKVLLVFLVLFLSIAANYNLSAAKRMYDAEEKYLRKLNRKHNADQGALNSPEKANTFNEGRCSSPIDPFNATHPGSSTNAQINRSLTETERAEIIIRNPDFMSLRSQLTEEVKMTPRKKNSALCSMFTIVMFLNVMAGGGAFESPWGIRCGSFSYWTVHVCLVAFLIASALAAQTYLVNRHEIRELVGGFQYVNGDVRWDMQNVAVYAITFMLAGVFAGMFGIGGGIVTTPVLLAAMHVHPEVAAATSSCMILFTSALSTASYSLFGMIHWDYAIAVFILGFTTCIFGTRIMGQARHSTLVNGRTFKRNSFIAYSVGGVLLLSAFLMTVQYIFVFVNYEDEDTFGNVCATKISSR